MKTPGISCPKCGCHVPVTLDDLVNEITQECPKCSASVPLDRDQTKAEIMEEMKAALDSMMDDTRVAMERLKALKR